MKSFRAVLKISVAHKLMLHILRKSQYVDFYLLLAIYRVQDKTIKTVRNCKSHYLNAW